MMHLHPPHERDNFPNLNHSLSTKNDGFTCIQRKKIGSILEKKHVRVTGLYLQKKRKRRSKSNLLFLEI